MQPARQAERRFLPEGGTLRIGGNRLQHLPGGTEIAVLAVFGGFFQLFVQSLLG